MISEATEYIIQADQQLFLWLNGLNSPFWDQVMQIITYKFTWIPLYLLLLYGMYTTFGKKTLGYLLCIIAVVALSDQIASSFFKPYFMRPRPCHDPILGTWVHVVGKCGGPFGFISSHASTSFGIAVSANLLPTKKLPGIKWIYLWAFVYSYSRVYVGVHYPLDVLVGALAGILIAVMLYQLYGYFPNRFRSEYI